MKALRVEGSHDSLVEDIVNAMPHLVKFEAPSDSTAQNMNILLVDDDDITVGNTI